jgi:uncharacterized protein (TIGR02145 family)
MSNGTGEVYQEQKKNFLDFIDFNTFNKNLIYMRRILFSIAILCAFKANAQTYLISFAGTGASATVSTVKVENITQGLSVMLVGSDILQLNLYQIPTGVDPVDYRKSSGLKIYPNPMKDFCTVEFTPQVAGDAVLTVSDMAGKPVIRIQRYLENSSQKFRLSGLEIGFYFLNITGKNYQFSGKLLCAGKSGGTITEANLISNVHEIGEKAEKAEKTFAKGTKSNVEMTIYAGDRFIFTGKSGNYSTIITDRPSSDKVISFNFIACTDGDNNNYPVVQIGEQVWMAENLKTTKFKDGITSIINKAGDSEWGALPEPAFCYYNNDEGAYKDIYGMLYNWYAVNTGKLCPTDWHVPSSEEWTILTTFLGGDAVSGDKLKESGFLHWAHYISHATNETGFTALPGGFRYNSGTFNSVGENGFWWSSSGFELPPFPDAANFREMSYNWSNVSGASSYMHKGDGFSVRCLQD